MPVIAVIAEAPFPCRSPVSVAAPVPPCATPICPEINESVIDEQVDAPAAVSAVSAWFEQVTDERSV